MRAKAARLERISLGRGLAALGQQDHVLAAGTSLAAHPIHQGQQLARGDWHAAPERAGAAIWPDLDALAEADLF